MRVLRLAAKTLASIAVLVLPLSFSAAAADAGYRLGPQDKLNIRVGEWRASRADVYEWKLLNGEFIIDASGNVSLPLLGDVKAQGLTPAELSNRISDRLQQRVGLADRPDAAVEVSEYRPFYIVGNVEHPGKYPYRPGMSVLQAVSVAGGWQRVVDPSLLRLQREAIVSRGDLRVVGAERDTLLARQARLQAELDDKDTIEFPAELTKAKDGDQSTREEQLIFRARKERLEAKIDSLTRLKSLLENEVTALQSKGAALDQQISLVRKELDNISSLVSRGLSYTARQLQLEQNVAQLVSTRVDVDLSMVRTRQDISKAERDIVDLGHERRDDILTDLRKTEGRLAELAQKAATAESLIHDSEVTAPRAED
ncbi:MAG: polysaccharide biosynthesis/export family protein, partial [Xanthobacteraceae bacterium]|nr:polysaccharide biosynthesis/export family protein [Xanthobacteraceae bacterium]